MAAILEVSGLKKTYKNFELKNVSFSIHEDCITGFIGVNGAGKTTTINALLNLVHRDGGIIKFRGKDISTDEKTFKDKIGVVFDSGCFYDELTIKDMTALLAPAYSEWDNHTYTQYLERFSLQQEQTIGTLSKGMKMKYALALALSHNAELLIMDEPTSGLDPLMREQFINILKSYIEPGGRAVFYSTHNTTDLDKSADMLIMINAGKILFDGKDITKLDITERAKAGIGFAFQQPVRFKGLTVKDLINIAAGNNIKLSEACDYLSDVGLCAKEYLNREITSSLSGGELKRIEIAMLAAKKSKLTVFDEPEAGIDLWSFNSLISVFEKMHQEIDNSSIVIISHQERILNIADEIVLIANGRVEKQGKKEEILPQIFGKIKPCHKLENKEKCSKGGTVNE